MAYITAYLLRVGFFGLGIAVILCLRSVVRHLSDSHIEAMARTHTHTHITTELLFLSYNVQ
jgi:hypothetical protein